MSNGIYKEFLTMFLIGIWLLLQCYHVICMEEEKSSRLCVISKLITIVFFCALYPFPIITMFLFFAFYPKYEPEGMKYGRFGLQILLPIGACIFCNIFGNRDFLSVLYIVIIILFGIMDLCIHSVLLKNQQLCQQMEHTALNELKVKNLNRRIALRSQEAEKNARLEEREHIARNIHNVVGHTITSALVSLQAYEVLKEADPKRADGKLSAASERMHLALEEIRRAVRVLDVETEDISLQDFCSLLCTEADKFSQTRRLK